MRPIRKGERGPSVEDVQRRLVALGSDIGPTGVDGVFLGATLAAVQAFQRERGLVEDGDVGPETWSALVDATFTLGDRLLYLRVPHFHGADVRALEGALNALGFAVGDADGIFGAFCERAVREFQNNSGLRADGIVGPDTVRALGNLRHVWEGKAPDAPTALRRAPARSAGVLRGREVGLLALDEAGTAVAERLCNLALASEPDARVALAGEDSIVLTELTMVLGERRAERPEREAPTVAAADGGDALARRLEVALCSLEHPPPVIEVVLSEGADDEHTMQRIAVGLLDGLCIGLARTQPRDQATRRARA